MTNKLVVIINNLKVPKIKKILLYETKFLVPNYSCLKNPWLGGYRPQIPVLSILCPQLNLLNPLPPNKIPGYATGAYRHELQTRLSQTPWKHETAKIPDWPRKAVAEFRLCVGHDCLGTHLNRHDCLGTHLHRHDCLGTHLNRHDCLGTHLHRHDCLGTHLNRYDCLGTHLNGIAIHPDPYCMLYSLREPMDSNQLGQRTALLDRTECERYWEARTNMMGNWFCFLSVAGFTVDAELLARSIRKVLRPATSTQVFLGFPVSISKCWDGSQHSKLPLHASHVALLT